MQLGVIFPQTEIGADPKAVRDFVQAAEGIGYEHVIVFTMSWEWTRRITRGGRGRIRSTICFTSPSYFMGTWRP
jgi:hypothetical protein